MTISDVAERAGVSKSTVSRIINKNYGHTTAETKERVLQVIKELNYQPNLLAKGLKQMKTNVLGIVLSNLKNSFWTRVLEGVEDTCRKHGYSLMICNSNEDNRLEEELIHGLQHRRVDGIVINPTLGNKEMFDKLTADKYPFVVVNRKVEGLAADGVVVDNRKGAQLAVEHLLSLGKKRLAALVYPYEGISTWQERVNGFKDMLAERGLAEDSYTVVVAEMREGAAKRAVQRLLAEFKPDGILSTNNMMTLEILEGIKEAGYTVPDDVAVLGYDETVWSKHLHPPLTTVNQPAYEMGVLAAQKLIKRIQSKNKPRGSGMTVLEPSLIVRQSCGEQPRT
ncbi:LacI family DNA-binding transcriptional regulator [Paenibacillus piri]|uniref:LacI family DNA-binding transcriptional regulator n=1 Tax=Paenibacillus piri TaxID=2547395 RepID=UPI001FEBEF11|nr:LacI family DNA-binding transcriptional regulator [Paenibacillus piri]